MRCLVVGLARDIRSQHREVIRNDQVVLRICPWPVRHRARLATEKAIVISGIGWNARETVLADPPAYAGIPPDMPTVRLGSDPNGVVRNASQSFGGVARQAIGNAGEKPTILNGRGSLDLSRRGIQSPKRAWRAVYEVRTVPENPFENTENSGHGIGVSLVRKVDDGGETARH